jgi:hypothetical protein
MASSISDRDIKDSRCPSSRLLDTHEAWDGRKEARAVNESLIVEMAQFRLIRGSDEQGFLKEADAVQKNFLKKQSGFIDRELLKAEDGLWVDILHWSTMEEAQRASEAMLKDPACAEFIRKIDPASISMLHVKQVRTYGK